MIAETSKGAPALTPSAFGEWGFSLRRIAFLISLIPSLLCGAAPVRVVSLLPSHTEILESLDAADLLVGVSDAERAGSWPGLPRVGGLVPRWEVLAALQPDLVLADVSHDRYRTEFKRFNIPVRFFPATRATRIEDVLSLIQEVGQAVQRDQETEILLRRLRTELAALDSTVFSGPAPRALFEIWPRPLQAVGRASLQGALLERAGFANIVPDTRNEMPLIASEFVVAARPDYIFHTGVVSASEIAGRPGWGTVPAVRNGRVIKLDADLFSQAGPRIIAALAILHQIRIENTP